MIPGFVREVRLKVDFGEATDFFRISILVVVSGHVLGEAKGLHAPRDGGLNYVFELILGVAGTELPRVTVH